MSQNRAKGQCGEEDAARILARQGYRILERNYRIPMGEIDIIAEEKGVLCFVEVKSRTSLKSGAPAEAVTPAKQLRLSRAALTYLKEKQRLDRKARFDVLSIVYGPEGATSRIIRNAFELCGGYRY